MDETSKPDLAITGPEAMKARAIIESAVGSAKAFLEVLPEGYSAPSIFSALHVLAQVSLIDVLRREHPGADFGTVMQLHDMATGMASEVASELSVAQWPENMSGVRQ